VPIWPTKSSAPPASRVAFVTISEAARITSSPAQSRRSREMIEVGDAHHDRGPAVGLEHLLDMLIDQLALGQAVIGW